MLPSVAGGAHVRDKSKCFPCSTALVVAVRKPKMPGPDSRLTERCFFLVVGMVCHCGLESHSQLLRLPERPLTVSVRQVTVKVV